MQAVNPSSKTVNYQVKTTISERLNNRVVEVVKEIVSDSEMRIRDCKGNSKLLEGGCFYPGTYFQLLKDNGHQQRLDYFVKKGTFYYGFASPKHFSRIDGNHFLIKEGVTACEALQAMRNGFSLIGCGEVCQIAYYEAIRGELGDGKFNVLFAANGQTPLRFLMNSADNPLYRVFISRVDPGSFSKGEAIYVVNAKLYLQKHVIGDFQGTFAICSDPTPGQETFLNMGLESKGMTIKQIGQRLLSKFNERPREFEMITEELKNSMLNFFSEKSRATTEDVEDWEMNEQVFTALGGGKVLTGYSLDAQKIDQLVKLTIKPAVKRLNSWKEG